VPIEEPANPAESFDTLVAIFGGGETKVGRILYTTWNDRIRVVETAFRHPTAFATGLTCGERKLFTSVSILPTVG
jgi:hypothetical protein